MSERVVARVDVKRIQEIPLNTSVGPDDFHGVVFYDDGFGYWLEGVDSDGERHEGEDLIYADWDTKEDAIQGLLSDVTQEAISGHYSDETHD